MKIHLEALVLILKSCPLCGTDNGKHLLDASDDDAFIRNNIKNLIRKFEVVKCNQCKFVYVKDTFDHQLLQHSDTIDNDILEIPTLKYRQWLVYGFLKKIVGKNKKILEVGCGFGELINYSTQHGLNYTAIEPSVYRSKLLQNLGLSVFTKTVEQFIEDCSDKYDIVIMDNVLEHVPEPKKILESLKQLMSDNSNLVIIVPNLNDIRSKIILKWGKKQWSPIGHVNYFTRKTLVAMLNKSGFSTYSPIYTVDGCTTKTKILIMIQLVLAKFKIVPFGLYVFAKKTV